MSTETGEVQIDDSIGHRIDNSSTRTLNIDLIPRALAYDRPQTVIPLSTRVDWQTWEHDENDDSKTNIVDISDLDFGR